MIHHSHLGVILAEDCYYLNYNKFFPILINVCSKSHFYQALLSFPFLNANYELYFH